MQTKYTGIPARVITIPITKFIGCSKHGSNTSTTQQTIKVTGRIKFTFIGLGRSGLKLDGNFVIFFFFYILFYGLL